MAISDTERQAQIADELHEQARALADSTREFPTPSSSYAILGSLGATLASLEQTCTQIGRLHRQAVDGQDYFGEDDRGDGTATISAAVSLNGAAAALRSAAVAIEQAHTANGMIRWRA